MRFHVRPTPNPNSLRIERADGQPMIPEGMRSFTEAAQATGDPLGEALFAVPGVAGVFALPAFVTVTKASEADWRSVQPAVEAALRAVLGG
jgi:NFU1 iron-sulfur cluster scaffold homolog, mitochondrial